jgi:hypothetical protein
MTITATCVAGYITGFTVTNPGNILFTVAPNVVISGGGGVGATASVQINANGVLTGIAIMNGGAIILVNTEYSRLPVPPIFLNHGYIEFELDTVLTAANNGTVYTAAQLNDLIIKLSLLNQI